MYKAGSSLAERSFTPLFVVGLCVGVALLAAKKPVLGLGIIGTLLTSAAVTVELNSAYIWRTALERYQKTQKSSKKKPSNWEVLVRPTHIAYLLNVFVVVPMVFIAGLLSLYAAYTLQ